MNHVIPGHTDLDGVLLTLCGQAVTHIPSGPTDCGTCLMLDDTALDAMIEGRYSPPNGPRVVRILKWNGDVELFGGATLVYEEERGYIVVISIPGAIVRESYTVDEWRRAEVYVAGERVSGVVNPT